MTINFLHVSDTAFFSEENKLSVIEIFNIIHTRKLPAIHPSFSISFGLKEYANVSDDLSLILTSPSGKPFYKIKIDKDFTKNGKKNTNLTYKFMGSIFKEAGDYRISIMEGQEVVNPERQDTITIKLINE